MEVKVIPYQAEWEKAFDAEKDLLKTALGEAAEAEQDGGTNTVSLHSTL